MDQASLSTANEPRTSNKKPINPPWTDEEKKIAIAMFTDGFSMGAIGDKLGRTRNAVSGQLDRHRRKANGTQTTKLRRGSKVVAKAVSKPKVDKRIPKTTKSFPWIPKKTRKVHRVRLRLIESETAVTFAELQPHHCKFPSGDPRNSDFRFCGHNREGSGPYCATHTVISGRMYLKE